MINPPKVVKREMDCVSIIPNLRFMALGSAHRLNIGYDSPYDVSSNVMLEEHFSYASHSHTTNRGYPTQSHTMLIFCWYPRKPIDSIIMNPILAILITTLPETSGNRPGFHLFFRLGWGSPLVPLAHQVELIPLEELGRPRVDVPWRPQTWLWKKWCVKWPSFGRGYL
jgi:hypothetical protein